MPEAQPNQRQRERRQAKRNAPPALQRRGAVFRVAECGGAAQRVGGFREVPARNAYAPAQAFCRAAAQRQPRRS